MYCDGFECAVADAMLYCWQLPDSRSLASAVVPAVEAAVAAVTFVGATGAAAGWLPLTVGTMAIPPSVGMGLYKKCRLYLSSSSLEGTKFARCWDPGPAGIQREALVASAASIPSGEERDTARGREVS